MKQGEHSGFSLLAALPSLTSVSHSPNPCRELFDKEAFGKLSLWGSAFSEIEYRGKEGEMELKAVRQMNSTGSDVL